MGPRQKGVLPYGKVVHLCREWKVSETVGGGVYGRGGTDEGYGPSERCICGRNGVSPRLWGKT